jgi:peptidoglycan-N-acetylglucosamine deacetylase
VFSIDTDADDWFRHVSPAQVVEKSISRLEKLHGGILLLHDIHPWTAQALPELLRQLKAHGFHVVHIVPPASAAVASANAVKRWTLALASADANMSFDGAAAPKWPQPSASDVADDVVLTAPDAATFDVRYSVLADASLADKDAASARWSAPAKDTLPESAAELAAPGLGDLGVSLHGRRLVGAELGLRASADIAVHPHERLRHARMHAHHQWRRARLDYEREYSF